MRPRSKSSVDLNRLEEHFASRCRAAIKIPYGLHREEVAVAKLDLPGRVTADACLELAAVVGDGWPCLASARRA